MTRLSNRRGRIAAALTFVALLCSCASAFLPPVKILQKGEPVSVQSLAATYNGQYACLSYDPATDSCESLIRFNIVGGSVVARETGLVPRFGKSARIEFLTTGTLEGQGACYGSQDISVATTDLPVGEAEGLIGITRAIVSGFGGVCTTYYRAAGGGYVASTLGRNGRPFPPGDVSVRFFPSQKSLRLAQQ